MTKKRSDAGGMLVGVVLILVMISILVPALIMRTQKESKDTVSSRKKTSSLHLAEAGQDRGAWKLRESSSMWTLVSTGGVVVGYNNDVEYADVDGGVYKISFSSGPASNQVTVLSKGKSDGTDDVRAISAVYSKQGEGDPVSALTINSSLTWQPNLEVHWGSVVSYGSIDSAPADYYPRKYAAGQIAGRDTVDDSNNGAMPGDDWANHDFASFYDLGVAPTIDLDYYRDKAKSLTGIPAMKDANQDPAGSGYFIPTKTQGLTITKTSNPKDYKFYCSTCVFFVEGPVASFPNKAELILEALVVTGDMDFNADDLNPTVTIPCDASDEYQYNDSFDAPNYFSVTRGWSDCASENLSGVGMQGFLYIGEDMENAGGGATLHGAMFVVGDVKVNTFTIYFDSTTAANVQTGGSGQMSRDSWDEVKVSW